MRIALKAYNGKYVTGWDTGVLRADRDAIGEGETFEVINLDPIPPTPEPVPPSNKIDLSQVEVIGSNPRCLWFPETAILQSVGLLSGDPNRSGELILDCLGTDSWPMVKVDPNDPEPTQNATLWVFLYIQGQWRATGAERLKPYQCYGSKPESGQVNDFIAIDWLYDPSRWGVMAGYVPKNGELVYFRVVAGSTRSDDNTPVEACSNLLGFSWPGNAGANPVSVVLD